MSPLPSAVLAAAVLTAGLAQAQPASCSSDGQAAPAALAERFINADCEACWVDPATPRPGRQQLALDWITPGGRGDDAPLAAAATRDALVRLQALGRPVPSQADAGTTRRSGSSAGTLRVAHGLPFNGYVGTTIQLRPNGSGPWTAWLVLVESLPVGAEGSPVERNLVRNLLQLNWDNSKTPGPPARLSELRSMRIPEGARPERLRVVGWVEDARGRIGAIAQTRCAPEGAGK